MQELPVSIAGNVNVAQVTNPWQVREKALGYQIIFPRQVYGAGTQTSGAALINLATHRVNAIYLFLAVYVGSAVPGDGVRANLWIPSSSGAAITGPDVQVTSFTALYKVAGSYLYCISPGGLAAALNTQNIEFASMPIPLAGYVILDNPGITPITASLEAMFL